MVDMELVRDRVYVRHEITAMEEDLTVEFKVGVAGQPDVLFQIPLAGSPLYHHGGRQPQALQPQQLEVSREDPSVLEQVI